jgi:CBS domain containing-hemolysin-like protein
VGALTTDEVQVIQGALDMVGKTAESVMTPVAKVSLLISC